MGWRGYLRSAAAAHRQVQREALREQRELERQHRYLEKMEELERAAFEVQEYENYIKVCLLYTSPSPRDRTRSRMPSSA